MFHLDFLNNLNNLDLLTVGIAVAAIGILGFVVYFSHTHSVTNRAFLFFAVVTIIYGIINFLNYQVSNAQLALWLLRFTLFSATWHAFALFHLFYVFPEEKKSISRRYKTLLLPSVIAVSILTLTPLVFSRIIETPLVGQVSNPERGPGMAVFGLLVLGLVVGGVINIVRKTARAKALQKQQFALILTGTILTFFLIIVGNFILPVFFNYLNLIPLAPIFFLPFIIFTAYSIIRYHLLDIKVVATEILTFLLTFVILFEIVNSQTLASLIFRILVFLLVLTVGILLIRSVRKEVKQREKLEILDKQLEAANDQLKILDQARSEFITIASHQLRTPPATIKWYLAAVLDGDFGKLEPQVFDALRKTMSTNNSMIGLIDDLLNASRIERGKMEFNFGPTDLVAITQTTIDQLLPQAEMKKLPLNFVKPKDPLPTITADKEKLRQVINNFIDNAIKYTEKGQITIEASKTKTDAIVKVTDTGRGVRPDQKDHVFGKFDRAKMAPNNSTGLGLGLYVAKVVVEQHNGKIWVESKGEGKGSSFCFSIPLVNKLVKSTFDLTKTQQLPPTNPPKPVA